MGPGDPVIHVAAEHPRRPAQEDPDYLVLGADHRRYWESGANLALTHEQQDVLTRWCSAAVGPASTDAERVWRTADFVHVAMPPGDSEGNESPVRPLAWIIDTGVGDGALAPPDTIDRPGWVCINAVALCAAMLRHMGYPVRECNVYLAQAGSLEGGFRGAIYQQAALQVWFDRMWHWVDPYLRTFDPAVTRDDRGRYKVDVWCYWSGTTTPTSWRPALQHCGWTPFGPMESPGPDLQRRLHPKVTDARGQELLPDAPDRRVLRLGSEIDRREGTTTSGVFVRTSVPGVTLSLQDSLGRVASRDRADIPGAVHIERGAPIFGLDPRPFADRTTPIVHSGHLLQHAETVFYGTRSLLASWQEIGAHHLTLHVEGPAGAVVDLHHDAVIGDHNVTVYRLPSLVSLDHAGSLDVGFEVVIDAVDAGFHAQYSLLLRNGLVTPEMYWPASDAVMAARERSRIAARRRGGTAVEGR